MQWIVWSHQKLERDKERFFPGGLQNSRALLTLGMTGKHPRLSWSEKLLLAKDSLLVLRTHHLHPVFTFLYDSPNTSCLYFLVLLVSVKPQAMFLFFKTFLINKWSTYCNSLNKIIFLIAWWLFIPHNTA